MATVNQPRYGASGPMHSGAMRRRITIQQRAAAQDSLGQQGRTWTDVCTCWAGIRPATGRELIAGQALNTSIAAVFELRYRPGIASAMRIVHGDQIWSIESVIDVELRRRTLELWCALGPHEE